MAVLTNSGGDQLTTNAGKVLVRDTGSILAFNRGTTSTKTTVGGGVPFNVFVPTSLTVELTVRSTTSIILLSASTVLFTDWDQTRIFLDFGVSGGTFANNTRLSGLDYGLAGGVHHLKGLSSSGNFIGANISYAFQHTQAIGTTLTYGLLIMGYDINQGDGAGYTADANYYNIAGNQTNPNQAYPIITVMEISD